MRNASEFRRRGRAIRSVTACAMIALAGCAGLGLEDETDGVTGDVAALAREAAREAPSFRPGDRFTFDNPVETWTVTGVEGDRVTWVSDGGARQVTTRNPLLPALEWTSPDKGAGRRLISGQTQPMFPLSPGKEVSFRATVDTDQPPFAWEFEWTCEVGGLEPTAVPAGEFATYRVACGRDGVEETVMFYAPEIGYNARMLVASTPNGSGTGAMAERRLTSFARAGDGIASGAPVAPAGAVDMQEATEGALPLRIGDSDGTVQEDGEGPTALGMIAGETVPATAATEPATSALADTASAPVAPSGSTVVHLASYKNPDNAEAGWKQLMAANRDLLEGTRPIVRQVDIPGRGIFYRLHAGPVASRGAGEEICKALARRGVYCKVTAF
jgi:hypothetical protein